MTHTEQMMVLFLPSIMLGHIDKTRREQARNTHRIKLVNNNNNGKLEEPLLMVGRTCEGATDFIL